MPNTPADIASNDSVTSTSDSDITTSSKLEAELNLDSAKITGTDTVTAKYGDNITATISDTASATFDSDGASLNLESKTSVDHKVNNNISQNVTHKTSAQLNGDDFKFGESLSTSTKIGDEENYTKYSDSVNTELSAHKGLSLSAESAIEQKQGNVENNMSINESLQFDGEKLSSQSSLNTSTKIGDKDNNVEFYNNYSVSSSGEDEFSESNTTGMNVKAGNVEVGSSYTSSSSETEDSVESSEKTENTVGVNLGEGVKLKNTTTQESSEKLTVDEESATYEETDSIKSDTRLEVDSAKAGVPAAIMATIFNTGMAFTEALTNVESTSKTEIPLQEQAEATEQETSEQEAEVKAQQEAEEKSIKEQVEEDTRVNEELQRESEEMMNEYENDRGYDPQEYQEELNDYSYDKEGEGKTGTEVDFGNENESTSEVEGASEGEGESADNSYDYYSGYGY